MQGPGKSADLSVQTDKVGGTTISETARDMATATLGRLVIDSLKEDDNTEANKPQEGKLLKINLDLWLWQANRVGEIIRLYQVTGYDFWFLLFNYSNGAVAENEGK